MYMNNSKFLLSLILMGFILAFLACNKEDDSPPAALTLQELTAGDVDLNAATSPTNVPPDATITATFSTEVDPATANNTNITLTRDYDDADIPVTVTASGNTVTIDPTEPLGEGTLYELSMSSDIMSTEGQALPATSRTFTTLGTFVPAGQVAYWNFEDNAEDQVGNYNASDVVDVTFVEGRSATFGKAAAFNGNTSIIEIPNGDDLINVSDYTLSFWVRTNSEDHLNADGNPAGHFVLGLGAFNGLQFEIPADYAWVKFAVQYEFADGTTGTAGDLFFNGDGQDKDNGGWQGTEVRKDLTGSGGVESLIKDKWAHIIFVYDNETKRRSLFINGELMQRENFNLWPEDAIERNVVGLKFNDNDEVEPVFAFGFIQSRGGTLWANEPWGGYQFPTANHFKGQLDDIRMFHTALTDEEISLLYNSEQP